MQQAFQQKALEQQGMAASLSRLIRREPITCPPDTSLAEAFTAMHAARTGSMVITEAGVPIGILMRRCWRVRCGTILVFNIKRRG